MRACGPSTTSLRRGEAGIWGGRDAELAGSRAAVHAAAHQLHGRIRFSRRPDPDQSPLHGIVPRRALLQGQQPARARLRGCRSAAPSAAARRSSRTFWWGWKTSPPRSPRRSRGSSDKAANDARKKTLTALEQACEQASAKAKSGKLKCQAVTLYEGGQYFLYKYKRYDDLRLVFAPESDIAAFGGDPDNFQFPALVARFLDAARLRARQARQHTELPEDRFRGAARRRIGVRIRVIPVSTARLETRAQLEFERDVLLPTTLLRASELRGGYIQFGRSQSGR